MNKKIKNKDENFLPFIIGIVILLIIIIFHFLFGIEIKHEILNEIVPMVYIGSLVIWFTLEPIIRDATKNFIKSSFLFDLYMDLSPALALGTLIFKYSNWGAVLGNLAATLLLIFLFILIRFLLSQVYKKNI
ncbi:hypothetical protein [Oceanobacillus oncorhynchi]|uniref:hypothetical protein n=1 Tax=Oceanobacillus oncorhynchi TaxID=545501 RepID=UPI0034D5F352